MNNHAALDQVPGFGDFLSPCITIRLSKGIGGRKGLFLIPATLGDRAMFQEVIGTKDYCRIPATNEAYDRFLMDAGKLGYGVETSEGLELDEPQRNEAYEKAMQEVHGDNWKAVDNAKQSY
jgi:hypothetical protein